MRARIFFRDLRVLKEAFGRAGLKMPGKTFLKTRDISKDAKNLAKKEIVFAKKVEEEKPATAAEEAAAATPAAGAPAAAEGKAEEKKEESGKKKK